MNIPYAKNFIWWELEEAGAYFIPDDDNGIYKVYFAPDDGSGTYWVFKNGAWVHGNASWAMSSGTFWHPNMVKPQKCKVYKQLSHNKLLQKLMNEYFLELL